MWLWSNQGRENSGAQDLPSPEHLLCAEDWLSSVQVPPPGVCLKIR